MNYTIKHITSEQELANALNFAKRIFTDSPIFAEMKSLHAQWHGHWQQHTDLLLYAKAAEEIVGIVFGYIGANDNMTVGIVAVDERFRQHGLAREMMLLIEERAKAYGVRLISLGAVQAAEGFYAKLGYVGSLLVQSKIHSIDDMLALNSLYEVRYTNIYNGTINQICLALPEADRELQRSYETELPGCNTQMMFWKNI